MSRRSKRAKLIVLLNYRGRYNLDWHDVEIILLLKYLQNIYVKNSKHPFLYLQYDWNYGRIMVHRYLLLYIKKNNKKRLIKIHE